MTSYSQLENQKKIKNHLSPSPSKTTKMHSYQIKIDSFLKSFMKHEITTTIHTRISLDTNVSYVRNLPWINKTHIKSQINWCFKLKILKTKDQSQSHPWERLNITPHNSHPYLHHYKYLEHPQKVKYQNLLYTTTRKLTQNKR